MEKSFIEELREAKKEYKNVFVNYFNDGEVRTDLNYMKDNLEQAKTKNEFYLITEVMKETTKRYGYHYDFDTVKLNLLLGLIYDANDVDKDNNIKENAEPIDGMIRFYTEKVDCFLDGEKTNQHNSSYSLQGFIPFNRLMKSIKETGLDYEGPQSFEELKERILNNEVFDITLTASLYKKEKKQEEVPEIEETIESEVKEEPVVVKESKIKKLFRR